MKIHISILILLMTLNIMSLTAQDRTSGRSFATRSEVLARNGMVAANHPLATQIGIEILKKGGSAIDAAIAANAFMGFADPAMNGVGGDLFAIVWDSKTEQLYGINASGRSPQALSYEQLQRALDQGKNYLQGPLSVTTPGCVDGWFELHQRFGKLPFSDLLQPTIQYAREGVPITQETSDIFEMIESQIQRTATPSFKEVYFNNDRFPRKGEIFKNPDLAQTLEIIGKEGRDAFYKGEIADKLVEYMKQRNGYLGKEDLEKHRSSWVDPISVNYRGYDVWELPPNGQGVSVLQILKILEGFDISTMGYGSAEHIHHFVEAKKLAYEDLATYYGDPDFSSIPTETLISDNYAETRRQLIDPNQAHEYFPGLESGEHTIYLTAADKDGNMISLIQSVSDLFGSKEVPDGLGFALQNRGSGFVMELDHVNVYAPGKRPFHTIIPAFVTKEGKPWMSFGLIGGSMQPQGHVQVLMNIIDFKMNLQEAGDAPRIRHNGTINTHGHVRGVGDTFVEFGFDSETLTSLMRKGHNLRMGTTMYGGYQAIMLKNGVYYGASESRKDGQAAGY